MAAARDHYETLGVSQGASQRSIRTAFRQLAVRFPPVGPRAARGVRRSAGVVAAARLQAREVSRTGAGPRTGPEPVACAPVSLFRDFWGTRSSIEVPLHGLGIRSVYLRIRVRVRH